VLRLAAGAGAKAEAEAAKARVAAAANFMVIAKIERHREDKQLAASGATSFFPAH